MPSGVSHGSAWPAGAAGAIGSKASSAKFGMRLMVPILAYVAVDAHRLSVLFDAFSSREPVSTRGSSPRACFARKRALIMVRMLVADDTAELFRAVILQRGLARQV